MPFTKVSHKFQVVIPKDIRKVLGISKGDILQVFEKSHEIVMKKVEDEKPLSLKNLKGLGKEIWKDIDVDEYIKKDNLVCDNIVGLRGERKLPASAVEIANPLE